jgi:chromodomain-helicase-DNA-binding protein 4
MGNRVLLFSQFLGVLDILEDFLTGLFKSQSKQERGNFCRIDGGTSTSVRQRNINDFNKPDSPYFCMLISTRAGGQGINLATANTVILFDPDWNPHMDLQASARVHRPGQKSKVMVIRLVRSRSLYDPHRGSMGLERFLNWSL